MMGRPAIAVRSWPLRWFLVVLLLTAWAGVTSAQSGPTIVRVEEDWELVVGEPALCCNAPQIVITISPLGHLESFHATLDLNHQNIPAYEPGGIQFEVWEGDVPLAERKFPNSSLLETPGETIRWTQTMELSDGALKFEITNGTSTTWGSFGGQGYLKDTVVTTLNSLNAYNPEVSVANSGVSYAGNRVQSLVLKRVRVYTSTGEMIEDATERVVHAQE